MISEQLRTELLAMRAEDKRVREELIASREMDGSHYVPRMEELHRSNAARLRELIAVYGWPGEDVAGKDGAEAAWFVTQHSIAEPRFQRAALVLIQTCVAEGRTPAWHAAYLEDRIATQEGKPQRYGTQWMEDPVDGRIRPLKLADPERVNELRESVGLGPLRPIPEQAPNCRRNNVKRTSKLAGGGKSGSSRTAGVSREPPSTRYQACDLRKWTICGLIGDLQSAPCRTRQSET